MKIRFTVLGEPQGKARPRTVTHGKGGKPLNFAITYTPQETVMYENLIITEFRRQAGNFRFQNGEYVDMRVLAYYSIPASTSKKKRKLMIEGKIRPTKKPDWDNIGKVVSDSLNNIAYQDDAHIVDAQVRKFYSEQPRIEVVLQTAKD